MTLEEAVEILEKNGYKVLDEDFGIVVDEAHNALRSLLGSLDIPKNHLSGITGSNEHDSFGISLFVSSSAKKKDEAICKADAKCE